MINVLVADTVQSLIGLQKPPLQQKDRIHIDSKLGIDGSGCHQIRQQLAEDSDDEQKSETNYIGTFWCPLSVSINEEVIWSNKVPNSVLFCRPLCLT